MPRMFCNGNGIFSHLQMGLIVMGFAEDLCYGLPNLETSIFCPNVTVHVQTEFDFFCCKGKVYHKSNGIILHLQTSKLPFPNWLYHNGVCRALWALTIPTNG